MEREKLRPEEVYPKPTLEIISTNLVHARDVDSSQRVGGAEVDRDVETK